MSRQTVKVEFKIESDPNYKYKRYLAVSMNQHDLPRHIQTDVRQALTNLETPPVRTKSDQTDITEYNSLNLKPLAKKGFGPVGTLEYNTQGPRRLKVRINDGILREHGEAL